MSSDFGGGEMVGARRGTALRLLDYWLWIYGSDFKVDSRYRPSSPNSKWQKEPNKLQLSSFSIYETRLRNLT